MKKKAFTLIELLVIVAIIAVVIALIATAVGNIGRKPQATAPTSNSDYDVKLLFTINDLKVYRFYDKGHYIYFVDGRNSKATWNQDVRSGKTTVSVPTEVETVK